MTDIHSDEAERLALYVALETARRDNEKRAAQVARARLRGLKMRFVRDVRLELVAEALAHAQVRPSAWAARHMCEALFGQGAAMTELVQRFAEHPEAGEARRTAADRSEIDLVGKYAESPVADSIRAQCTMKVAQYVAHGHQLRARACQAVGVGFHGLRPLDD